MINTMNKKEIAKYQAFYFRNSKKIAFQEAHDEVITMQFFMRKKNAVLCGMNEALKILVEYAEDYLSLKIEATPEGSIIQPEEPVLKITGHYWQFGHLEGLIDGILAHNTTIATNAHKVVQAAKGKTVIYMNDRHDWYYSQAQEGYAAYTGGIRHFVTEEHTALIQNLPQTEQFASIPHALIQLFNGDLIKAIQATKKTLPNKNIIALVDYNNDVITDSLAVAKAVDGLYGVRVDTSPKIIDQYFTRINQDEPHLYGGCSELIFALRKALDENNFQDIKIILSSGLDDQQIHALEEKQTPVDIYGVGTFFVKNHIEFTGDAVVWNSQPQSKIGRKEMFSNKLIKLNNVNL